MSPMLGSFRQDARSAWRSLRYWTTLISLLFACGCAQRPASPVDVVQATIKAIENIQSVEYEVRGEYSAAGARFKGRTTIIATRSPFRFRAKLQGDDRPITQLAVSDGKTTRASYDGKTSETDTFAPSYPSEYIMPALGQSNLDVSYTWRLLLDPGFFSAAVADGQLLLVMQDDIDGDLCNVVLHLRKSEVHGTVTDYLWLSVKTGLPRAVQRLSLNRGRTQLSSRQIISTIHINPAIASDLFSYTPLASDSSTVTPDKTAAPVTSARETLTGRQLAEFDVRNMENAPLKISSLIDKPTILTLWAPWCSPCLAEFAVFQKIQTAYRGQLQVLAVAVQDSRLNVVEFVRNQRQYGFVFLTDPELPAVEDSKLLRYLLLGQGIPVSLFVDGKRRVLSHWSGFDGEEDLVKKIQQLMDKAKSSGGQ